MFNGAFDEVFYWATREEYPNRPQVRSKDNIVNLFLNDNMHQWFEENNIKYDISASYTGMISNWYLDIFKDDQAMLFKLTWK